jgi:hypothetical protein
VFRTRRLPYHAPVVPAHQGGWDELLFVGTPVVVFAFLLWLARTRAQRELEEEQADDAVEDPSPTDS